MGKRLLALRKRSGLSRLNVSAASTTSPTTIAQIEASGAGHLGAFERIAGALGAGLMLAPAGQAISFFNTAAVSSASETWATPQKVLAALYDVIGGGFDLDPCAARRGRSLVRARVHFDEDDDGLSQDWYGSVFLNPPYGRGIALWTEKACREVASGRASVIVGLLPARTDTQWWHSTVIRHADTWLLKGRLAFGGGDQAAPFSSALVIWGATQIHRERMAVLFPNAWHADRPGHDVAVQQLAAD